MAGPAQQAHLDTLARQLGYHDYATYAARQQHIQQDVLGANPATGVPGEAGAPQQPATNNWLQNLIARIPIHPAYLFGKVNDAFTQAGQ